MAVLDPNEIMFRAFEPKVQNRFIMYVDAIPSFMIKNVTAPSFTDEEVKLDHMNTYRKIRGKRNWENMDMTLYDPITPSGAQAVMDWARLSYESVTGRDGYADFYINNSSANTDVGKWEHVAWTYSGTNLKVYVNGEFIGSFYHEYSNGPANTSNISNAKLMTKYIGYNSSATIHGEIDEVRFWNDKRTASEIADNMFIELNGDEAGLVAYYKMTNGTGTTLTDNSSNSYNGTLKNMNNNDWVTSYAPIGNLNNDYRNSIKAIWAKTSTSQYSLSSNGLFFKIDAALTEQNFVVFGNNNLSSSSASDLPAGVVKRSKRIWHLYESGTVETNVIFDISDVTGNNPTVGASSNYKLLYRSGTSGDFSVAATANGVSGDNITFSTVNLNDGYYCIGVTQNNGL